MTLVQVVEYPAQDLFEIKMDGKDQHVLIPVIDPFIERVDKAAKVIHLRAPEELYSL
jgi:ribosomal 30S subunit maturation factor RimM